MTSKIPAVQLSLYRVPTMDGIDASQLWAAAGLFDFDPAEALGEEMVHLTDIYAGSPASLYQVFLRRGGEGPEGWVSLRVALRVDGSMVGDGEPFVPLNFYAAEATDMCTGMARWKGWPVHSLRGGAPMQTPVWLLTVRRAV